ncbi:MAG: hypothetical protein HYX36_00275 [Rhizobiales bacterium]|nr:hypothetical protein [Hyphomicrobiales bacterium]
MLHRAGVLGLLLTLLAGDAAAGQASGTLNVGIVIGASQTQAPQAPSTFTWGAAAISVEKAGFGNLQRVAKSGTLYWFEAERDGGRFRVGVSVSSGEIVEVNPA